MAKIYHSDALAILYIFFCLFLLDSPLVSFILPNLLTWFHLFPFIEQIMYFLALLFSYNILLVKPQAKINPTEHAFYSESQDAGGRNHTTIHFSANTTLCFKLQQDCGHSLLPLSPFHFLHFSKIPIPSLHFYPYLAVYQIFHLTNKNRIHEIKKSIEFTSIKIFTHISHTQCHSSSFF